MVTRSPDAHARLDATMADVTHQPPSAQPVQHVYYGFDRKACKVQLDDGTWVDAEIRGWDRDVAGEWTAHVMWSRGPGQGNHLERFARERMRSVA